MLLGASFMMAETLGFLLAASFIVFQAYVSGNALYNSKILIDSNNIKYFFFLNNIYNEKLFFF